jgi:hypothetical protein
MKGFAIGLVMVLIAVVVLAQSEKETHRHMGHLTESWGDTPDKVGLLTILEEEAQIAAQHAGLAARDLSDLSSMQTHTGHVRHAFEAASESVGPGKGYGVLKAAQGVSRHISLASNAGDASDNVKRHAEHVKSSAENVVKWGQEVMQLSEQVLSASAADQAAPLVQQIQELTQHIVNGTDANGDGRVSWQAGEGGVAQAKQHMDLMARGEVS